MNVFKFISCDQFDFDAIDWLNKYYNVVMLFDYDLTYFDFSVTVDFEVYRENW